MSNPNLKKDNNKDKKFFSLRLFGKKGDVDTVDNAVGGDFDSVQVSEATFNNWVAAVLAISMWLMFLGTIFIHIQKMDNFAKAMVDSDKNNIERIEKAANLTKETYSRIYTILGTLTGSVTGFYFGSSNKKNQNS